MRKHGKQIKSKKNTVDTPCALCGSYNDYKILYKKNFTELDLNKTKFSARRLPDKCHYQTVRCKKDGLIRATPIININLSKKLYKESCFTYKDEVDNLSTTYLNALKQILSKLSIEVKILEIGCGNGFLLSSLNNIGFKNVFGVEPSNDSINKADIFIKKRIKHSIFKNGLFPNNTFSLICFFQTLDHIPDPNNFLQICYKLLKKDGFIVGFNHNAGSISAKLLREKSPIIDIEHTYLYDKQTIRMLFKKNNFTDILVFSPSNTLSIKHFLWLFPLPGFIKTKLLNNNNPLLRKSLRLKLGNLCIIAKK